MSDEQLKLLDDASSTAFDALAQVEDDPIRLAEPLRVVALVSSAQAAIDNGGLSNFFGADFWHDLPYEAIIHAYRLCGAAPAADVLEEALRFFPFDMPHRKVKQRRIVLEALEQDERSRFWELNHMICGDKRVHDSLADYVRQHPASFPPRKPLPGLPRNEAKEVK